jgi:hypothetical protein
MARRPLIRPGNNLVIGMVMVAFALRALVPSGYMPSSEVPFTLAICPEGVTALSLRPPAHSQHHHHHHAGSPADEGVRFDHCPFGAAPGAAVLTQTPVAELVSFVVSFGRFDFPTLLGGTQLVRAQQARAPPVLS